MNEIKQIRINLGSAAEVGRRKSLVIDISKYNCGNIARDVFEDLKIEATQSIKGSLSDLSIRVATLCRILDLAQTDFCTEMVHAEIEDFELDFSEEEQTEQQTEDREIISSAVEKELWKILEGLQKDVDRIREITDEVYY